MDLKFWPYGIEYSASSGFYLFSLLVLTFRPCLIGTVTFYENLIKKAKKGFVDLKSNSALKFHFGVGGKELGAGKSSIKVQKQEHLNSNNFENIKMFYTDKISLIFFLITFKFEACFFTVF